MRILKKAINRVDNGIEAIREFGKSSGLFDDVEISDEDCDYYDEEMVYARLLRRFQGENVFVPRNSPSMFF